MTIWGLIKIIAAAIILLPSSALAGAWNLPRGEGQAIITYSFASADRAFFDDETLESDVDFAKEELRVFYEHGLTKNVTAVVNAAHQTIGFIGPQSTINFKDFDKTELGLRYQLLRREGLAVSVQGSYIIGGGPPESILDIGSRDDSFELRGLWGQSKEFEKFVVFFDAQAAIRARNTNGIEDWRADLTLGWKDKKKSMFLLQGYHTERLEFSQGDFIVPIQKRTKLQASFVYALKKNTSVQAGVTQTLAGRNVLKERSVTAGVWHRY
jgi:hypothetical protein